MIGTVPTHRPSPRLLDDEVRKSMQSVSESVGKGYLTEEEGAELVKAVLGFAAGAYLASLVVREFGPALDSLWRGLAAALQKAVR